MEAHIMNMTNDSQHLSAIMANTHNIIIFLNPELTITNLNPPAVQLFDLPAKEIIGANFSQLCTQQQIPCPISTTKSLKNPETTHQEQIIQWKLTSISNPTGFVLIGNDISKLRQEQDKTFQLDSIIAAMPGNVYWYDKDFKYLGCNENSAKFWGIPREETIGKNIYTELVKIAKIKKESYEDYRNCDIEVMRTGIPQYNIEQIPGIDATGKMRHFLASREPLFNKKGEIIGLVGVAFDITERKMAQKALREEKEVNKAKTRFMATMAQALKNPITSASAIFRLISLEPLNRKQKKHLQTAEQNLSKAQNMLQDILDYANTDAEEQNTNLSLFDLRKLIADLQQKYTKQLKKIQVTTTIDYAPKIHSKVIGDYECIRMLIDSLFSNATNFMDKGNISLTTYEQKCQETWETELILKIDLEGLKNDLAPNQQIYVSQLNGAEFLFQLEEQERLK